MTIKLTTKQTHNLETKLAGFIDDIRTAPDRWSMNIAQAKAEGALEAMSEMGYPALSAEAQQGRINTELRKTSRALSLLERTQVA